jgi:hypothetical protein
MDRPGAVDLADLPWPCHCAALQFPLLHPAYRPVMTRLKAKHPASERGEGKTMGVEGK